MTKKKNETPEERESRLSYLREYRQGRPVRTPEQKAKAAAYARAWRAKKLAEDPSFRDVENERSRRAKIRFRAKPGTKEKEKAYRKEYIQRPEVKRRMRDASFKHHAGITREGADAMAEAQGRVCKICGLEPSGKRHHARLHVDHCHETGKIRGMLCHSCNTAIGLLRESPDTLRAAIKYLA